MLIPQHNKDALHLQNKKKIMENENKHTIQALSHCNTDNFNFKMRKKKCETILHKWQNINKLYKKPGCGCFP